MLARSITYVLAGQGQKNSSPKTGQPMQVNKYRSDNSSALCIRIQIASQVCSLKHLDGLSLPCSLAEAHSAVF